jgi:hypothetical protein
MATTFNTTLKNFNISTQLTSKKQPTYLSKIQESDKEIKPFSSLAKSSSQIILKSPTGGMEVEVKTFETLMGKLRKKNNGEKKEDGRDLFSRDTMYRFYSKDNSKLKRLKTPGYVGLDSYTAFYKKYNNADKELELGNGKGYSPSTAYLNKVMSLKIIPSTMGLLQHKGEHNVIRADNMKIGKNYALALSSSMKFLVNT